MDYRSKKSAKFATLELTKTIDKVIDRFPVLVDGKDKAGEFYRKSFGALFAYVTHRIPEITDELYKIDDAMKAGFGWEHGPFQIWDAVGLEKGLEFIKAEGLEAASWVTEMKDAGIDSFYTIKEGNTYFYDIPKNLPASKAGTMEKVPGQDAFIILDNIKKNQRSLTKTVVLLSKIWVMES